MAISAADVAGVVQSATAAAAGIERTNEQVAAQDPGAPGSSGFDVWTHTVAGAAQQMAEDQDAVEPYRALGDAVSGDWAHVDATAAEASLHQQASEALKEFQLLTGQREPAEGEVAPGGFLAGVGATFDILTRLEQTISAPLALFPFPAFPAIRVADMDIGLPHGHTHPPNTPPTPPLLLPSTGPIIPIPFLSGGIRTLINGMPAARCGDMGLGVWCGGYFPMYEVFLGSSSVWIEGARAGRLLVDVTRHCMFSSPKPTDPPLGPMVGMTITSSPNVLIGGVPFPSLLNLAMGAAVKGLFKGIGKAVKKVKAMRAARAADDVLEAAQQTGASARQAFRPSLQSYWERLLGSKACGGDINKAWKAWTESVALVDDMIRKGRIVIDTSDANLRRVIQEDLYMVGANPIGRDTLKRIAANPNRTTTIRPVKGPAKAKYHSGGVKDQAGNPGRGSDATVEYDPLSMSGPGTPPDATLNHELAHAANVAEGQGQASVKVVEPDGSVSLDTLDPPPEPASAHPHMNEPQRLEVARERWTNMEEYDVIRNQDNPYRDQYNLPGRWGHKSVP